MTTLQPSPSSFGQTGGSLSSPGDDWQQLADTADIDEEGLKEVYVAALEECKYDSAELESVHTLAEKAQQMLNPRFVILQRTVFIYLLPPSLLPSLFLHPSFLLTPLHQRPISLHCFLILCLPPPPPPPPLPPFPPFPPSLPPSLPSLPPFPPSRSPKVKAILRDMKQLQESLPIHSDSAILVRQVGNSILWASHQYISRIHTSRRAVFNSSMPSLNLRASALHTYHISTSVSY